MPTHLTYAITWMFDLAVSPTTDREVKIKDPSLGGLTGTGTIPALTGNEFRNGVGGFMQTFAVYLGQAYDNAGLNVGSGFDCYLNDDGYVVIENLDDLDCELVPTPLSILMGFGASNVELPSNPTSPIPVVAEFHPRWMWCPRTPIRRDTVDMTRRATATSRTNTGRPITIEHAADWTERVLLWETVPSALVRLSRAQDTKYQSAPPIADGEDQNVLEVLVDYIRSEPDDASTHPDVYVLNNVTDEEMDGPYRINLARSLVLNNGVLDENMLYEDTSKETYKVKLHLRKPNT